MTELHTGPLPHYMKGNDTMGDSIALPSLPKEVKETSHIGNGVSLTSILASTY